MRRTRSTGGSERTMSEIDVLSEILIEQAARSCRYFGGKEDVVSSFVLLESWL